MLTERARGLTRRGVEACVAPLAAVGVPPDLLTLIGLVAHVPVAALLATGHLREGAVALAVAAAVDGLDGALARRTGRATPFGAFLDSTFDRVSEIMVFAGLSAHALRSGSSQAAALCLLALGGSLMVSYTRARSEALGLGTKAGMLGRLERMVVLVTGLLTERLVAVLWILAVLTWVTTLQRILDVRRRSRSGG